VFKPEKITQQAIDYAKANLANLGPLKSNEKKTLTIIALMFLFWIGSTWFPAINTTAVALLGMVCFFLPGVEVLTWKQFSDNASWDVLFMIGGVNALAASILQTGAAGWLVGATMSGAGAWPTVIVILVVSALTCVLHILIPSGPAVAGLAVVPMISVATMCGISPTVLAVLTAFWGGVTFLLPIDAVPLLTYRYGYYKMTDMIKSGWIISIIMIVVAALFIPPVLGLLGY
jgi:sodium-dependent dicarboxylate transporter 2/3/5